MSNRAAACSAVVEDFEGHLGCRATELEDVVSTARSADDLDHGRVETKVEAYAVEAAGVARSGPAGTRDVVDYGFDVERRVERHVRQLRLDVADVDAGCAAADGGARVCSRHSGLQVDGRGWHISRLMRRRCDE
jgi:hypothetical protein